MDKLLITLSAASQEIDSGPAPIRIVDASKRRLPLQKEGGSGHDRRGIPARAGRGGERSKHHGPAPNRWPWCQTRLGLGRETKLRKRSSPLSARGNTPKTQYLEVAAGLVAGVAPDRATVLSGGVEKNLHGIADVCWRERTPAITAEITGNPNLTLHDFPGGTHGDIRKQPRWS